MFVVCQTPLRVGPLIHPKMWSIREQVILTVMACTAAWFLFSVSAALLAPSASAQLSVDDVAGPAGQWLVCVAVNADFVVLLNNGGFIAWLRSLDRAGVRAKGAAEHLLAGGPVDPKRSYGWLMIVRTA